MSSAQSGPARVNMTDLPFDILLEIFVVFAEEYSLEVQDHVCPNSVTAAGRALRAMVLTSRQFNTIATPLLYRTVVIYDTNAHRQLIRTISINPNLSRYIRGLSFFEYDDSSYWFQRPRSLTHVRTQTQYREHSSLFNLTLHKLPLRKMLWDGVRGQEADLTRRWDNYNRRRRIRDAVLDLFDLLFWLPNIRYFRYNGFACRTGASVTIRADGRAMSGTIFQTMVSLILETMQPNLRSRLFTNLRQLQVTGLYTSMWPTFLNNFISFTSHTLTLSSGLDHFGTSLSGLNFSSPRIRVLKVDLVYLGLDCFATLLESLNALEVLGLKLMSFFHPELSSYSSVKSVDDFLARISRHRETLKELRIAPNDHRRYSVTKEKDRLVGHDWSLFTRLKVLDILDFLIFKPYTTMAELTASLPPHLEYLTVTAWLEKEWTARVMCDLASGSTVMLGLRGVAILEWHREDSSLEKTLVGVQDVFRGRGMLCRYDSREPLTRTVFGGY
ncbi:hypothetical protein BJY04DRAFT_217391 [Aspergillus karnatakaensis]|uniref:uncharacterized protein n=1 Tax=Aspergillus karnatakaensis TaxID=1810916 RepID=UPI003CCD6E3E